MSSKSNRSRSGASLALKNHRDNPQEDLTNDHCSVTSPVNQLYYEANQMPSERKSRLTSLTRNNIVAQN